MAGKTPPKTAAERKREERVRKAEKGLVTVSVEVPEVHRDWLTRTALILKRGGQPPGSAVAPEPLKVVKVEVDKPIPVPGPVKIERVEVPVRGDREVYERYRTPWLLLAILVAAAAGGSWWLARQTVPVDPTPRCAYAVQIDPKTGHGYCWVN